MRFEKVMLLCLWFALTHFGYAQTQGGKTDQPPSDLASLRADVKALQAEQQQIACAT